jgi:hypothetical protein
VKKPVAKKAAPPKK